ncbi:hypothetical protein BJX63DRAFT_436097 [Aspergillus granulosus]|uniref:RNA polymerase sigma factor 70 region 4 type 2 domain-containing protein n=1 Tax=Aspergillus granulosus TaxID=176169 RepID=A0ABR4GZ97_9EURO
MGADLATRAQVISLKAFTQKTFAEIAHITGLSVPTTRRIFARAIERGFEPDVNPVILDEYVKDSPRSGRPTKQDTGIKDSVLSKYRGNRYLCYHYLADSPESRIPQNEADSEAWIDEEDESRVP